MISNSNDFPLLPFSSQNPLIAFNLLNGKWIESKNSVNFPDPLTGGDFLKVYEIKDEQEIESFISASKCSKSGLHNPFKNVDRYLLMGSICQKASSMMHQPEVEAFFINIIQRVFPKSYIQAKGEVNIVRRFLENFSGDSVRFLCRSFNVTGDHAGQFSSGYRFPFGSVCIISPFNFPLEIPALQLLGALFMGNKVLIKTDSKVSPVLEQFIRLLIFCGLPASDLNFINTDGQTMEKLLLKAQFSLVQFTGSQKIADKLAGLLKGRIKIEDAGYDWKILGPDVKEFEYVCWVSDQDAYALSGQKCSAQSIVFAHENWMKNGFVDKIGELAKRRKLEDLTISPVMTWDNKKILDHIEKVLKIEGSYLCFGGKALTDHSIPSVYGSFEPTAIFVPLSQLLPNFDLVTTELFGPFQIITSFFDQDLDLILEILEKMSQHLTAAIVSNDNIFNNYILGNTINGTTYCGIRARTTGAPQNHWFGPAGDPRAAGIGSPESIINVWSCHREIITDVGPVNKNWTLPPPS